VFYPQEFVRGSNDVGAEGFPPTLVCVRIVRDPCEPVPVAIDKGDECRGGAGKITGQCGDFIMDNRTRLTNKSKGPHHLYAAVLPVDVWHSDHATCSHSFSRYLPTS